MTTRLVWFLAKKRPGTRAITNSRQLQNNCPLFVWQNQGNFMQNVISLVTCLASCEKKSIASCRSHITRCNLELQLAKVSKQSEQPLQKIGLNSALCKHCKPKKLPDKLQRGHVAHGSLSCNATETQVTKKLQHKLQ